jgi:hypothetical protein
MKFRKLLTPLIALLIVSASAWAQDKAGSKVPDSLSGAYKGTGKSDATGEFPLSVDVKVSNGKVTGTISSPQGDAAITDGTYADGHITMKFDAAGNEGTVDAQYKDGRIVGTWALAGITGTLDLGKGDSGAMASSKPAAAPSAGGGSADALAGQWDATASVGGMDYPFTLNLVVTGDKITGQTVNQMGSVDIKSGSRTGDKISLAIETPQFNFTLTGTLKDGKLSGEISSDQFQGTWEAKKK